MIITVYYDWLASSSDLFYIGYSSKKEKKVLKRFYDFKIIILAFGMVLSQEDTIMILFHSTKASPFFNLIIGFFNVLFV